MRAVSFFGPCEVDGAVDGIADALCMAAAARGSGEPEIVDPVGRSGAEAGAAFPAEGDLGAAGGV